MKIVELEFTNEEWKAIEDAAKYYQNWSDTITNDKGEVIANPVTTEDLFIRELNKHFSFYIESHAQALIAQQAQNQSRKIEGKEEKKMKVKTQAVEETQQPNRQVNIDELVQIQSEKIRAAEQQLAYEQGKLRMLLELITPPQMTQPEPASAQ